jgi:5-methylcytosine-specific restriction endonuclease McrA
MTKTMRLSEYHAYLRSPEWEAKKLKMFQLRGRHCERCGSRKDIEVHHKTYKRLGRERYEDLEVLCGYCHGLEGGYERLHDERVGDIQRLNENDFARVLKRVLVRSDQALIEDAQMVDD